MKVRFQLKDKQVKESLIFLVVSIDARELKKSTNIRIQTKYWQKGYPKLMNETKGVRICLDEIKTRLNKLEQEYYLANRPITHELIATRINDIISGKIDTKKCLVDLFDQFESEKATQITSGTLKVYQSLKNHLINFEVAKKSKFQLEDINRDFGQGFTTFLLHDYLNTVTGKTRKAIQNPTVNKQIQTLKAFCNWAYDRGYTRVRDFEKIKGVDEHDQTIIALFPDELKLVEKYVPKLDRLKRVKDIFLFSCYTGLRYQDLYQVSKDHVKENTLTIAFTQKNQKMAKIPVVDKAMDILTRNDFRMPEITNQKLNIYIKELCEKAGITSKIEIIEQRGKELTRIIKPKCEIISIHDGRKTFITNCLMAGLNTQLVMDLSTHNELKAFRRYVTFADSHKRSELNKVF